ncbi:MAG: hypothetical protein ACJ71N_12530 [Terriglobales bacterium]|jgi:hypothetical protein
MSPEIPKNKKNPDVAAAAGAALPEASTPERVRKPHYDWEHETQAEMERPRVKAGLARMCAWKENVEAWIKRYLLFADSSFGGRDDDFNAA